MHRNLPEDVTVWSAVDDSLNEFGARTYSAPRLIKGRWEDIQIDTRTPTGEEFFSTSVVYVSEDITIGDSIARGDFRAYPDASACAAAKEVRLFAKANNMRMSDAQRKAVL